MLELEEKKKQEIKHMVTILEQIDLPDILLLTRDANTLLIRQREAEKMEKKAGQEVSVDVEERKESDRDERILQSGRFRNRIRSSNRKAKYRSKEFTRISRLAMLRKATTGLWKGFYPLSKPKKKKSESAQKAKKKSFNNFDGRKYDMDALEAQMLAADEVRGCK